jgi:hypothetical protein
LAPAASPTLEPIDELEEFPADPRADTLASVDRVEKIVKNTKARFIVQHDCRDVATLPKFPAYLE